MTYRFSPLYYVYYNLHQKVWSIKYRNKVIDHMPSCFIPEGIPVIQPAGQARVRKEGCKNVHAFIASLTKPTRYSSFSKHLCQQAYYNPYNVDTFMAINGENFEIIGKLEDVYFTTNRKVFFKRNIPSIEELEYDNSFKNGNVKS